jgi:hypothetical protein
MRKNKEYLFILIAACILAYAIFIISKAAKEDSQNPITVITTIPSDYLNLFNSTTKQKLTLQSAAKFKLSNTICYLNYDNKYDLELTKININSPFDIDKNIVEDYKESKSVVSDRYLPNNKVDFTSNYITISSENISKIYLSLYGDSIRTITKNDSVAYYYLKLKNVSIQHQPNGVKEIFIDAKTEFYLFTKKPQISLAFIRKQNSLYFLLLAAKDDSTQLDSDLLQKLIF